MPNHLGVGRGEKRGLRLEGSEYVFVLMPHPSNLTPHPKRKAEDSNPKPLPAPSVFETEAAPLAYFTFRRYLRVES
ncbi:hypothetical protein [Algisphaera agarilytica]|uniref:hypothetical protein n=1 Tax=Algisphaera agarilytica TaxID=1385975 RepID=UPI001608C120|nr:hypothetical protein [Algisphaera agarilytica]